jgi:hypothetical protein
LILSDKSKAVISADLESSLEALSEKPSSRLGLVVRTGSPFLMSELSGVSVQTARSVLIMDSDDETETDAEISSTDLNAVKLLLGVSELVNNPRCQINVETESQSTADKINELKESLPCLRGKNIGAYSFNRKLGQLLALSVMCPRIAELYTELLSFRGCEFYDIGRVSVEERLSDGAASIPILAAGEHTYVLAANAKAAVKRRAVSFSAPRKLMPTVKAAAPPVNLYVIGENAKTVYMIDTLKRSEAVGKLKTHFFKTAERERFLESLAADGGKKTAVILSDDSVPSRHYDANVFLTLIDLNRRFPRGADFEIIVEILDSKNQIGIKKFDVSNMIISNRIISCFAEQLMTKTDAMDFYENIFSVTADVGSGFDIWISPAEELFDLPDGAKFSCAAEFIHAAYYGSDKKLIPLGIAKPSSFEFFCENLYGRELCLEPTDAVIHCVYSA